MTRRLFLVAVVVSAIAGWFGSPRSVGGESLKLGAPAPDVAGGPWIGSEPLTIGGLRGRVVLVEFWTHG